MTAGSRNGSRANFGSSLRTGTSFGNRNRSWRDTVWDFALHHRYDTSRRWLLEIVGYWTPDYVRRKLALYREAQVTNLILCIDEARVCDEECLPAGAVVVKFRRRVDAGAVRRILG
jgi:predicted nuclease of restriction endonuclease-like RecB superfamily